MKVLNKRLNIKANLTDLLKRMNKKVISPMDILFLTLSGIFIGLFVYEISATLIHTLNHHGNFTNYILQIKYQLLVGFTSVILFLFTIILWIKQKLKSLLNYIIPIVKKSSLHWALLVIAFALNSFFFILN